eukprot:gene5053-3640_t
MVAYDLDSSEAVPVLQPSIAKKRATHGYEQGLKKKILEHSTILNNSFFVNNNNNNNNRNAKWKTNHIATVFQSLINL